MSAGSGSPPPLVICSKSTWAPAIRREHALATLAVAHGHPVRFLERPLDVRALRHAAGARAWWGGLRAHARPGSDAPSVNAAPQSTGLPGHLNGPSVMVTPQSTVLPGHLNALSEVTSNLLLRRPLKRSSSAAALVVNVPWQWPASSAFPGRRVFDCADDWRVLAGHRSERIAELYRRIAREADAVIVAASALAEEFPADRTVVVRNGVSDEMLGPIAAPVGAPTLIHAGTLTPRFDARLAAAILDELEDWTLELYGQCQYPGCQERPGPELARLLREYAPRVRWHGVVDRAALSGAIDHAAVALVLNRAELSVGQDSMKLYDYAARGRPILTTAFAPGLEAEGPPHMLVSGNARELAAAIRASRGEPQTWARERRAWADQHRWEARWSAWSAAIFGSPERAQTDPDMSA